MKSVIKTNDKVRKNRDWENERKSNKLKMNNKIAIIGQGYVGLPLAIEFGKKFNTIGFDIDKNRISELKKSIDKTNEATSEMINESKFLKFSNSVDDIRKCNVYIVTVPTPIDSHKTPNLDPVKRATSMLFGKIFKKG